MPFTAEELAELAAFDAEIDDSFQITPEEMAFSRAADRAAMLSRKDNRGRKVAEYQKAYYEANKDKVAEQRRRKRKEKNNAQSEVSRRHLSGQGPVGADPAV